MSDRELLEAAAKACGIELPYDVREPYGLREWNPLTDDGDAMRLAVKLNLTVVNEPHECEVFSEGECLSSEAICGLSMVATSAEVTDPYAATRRAIVRAAAALSAPVKEMM